jgi:hypothetical protein
MNLQLPPERKLPDPDRMLDEILTETEPSQLDLKRPSARGKVVWISGLATAAAVAITVAAIGVAGTLADRKPDVATTVAPSPSVSSPSASAGKVPLGTAVTFDHFTVTVSTIRRSTQGVEVEATVCVRTLPPNPTGQTTRISWDPWTVATGEHTYPARSADPSHPAKGAFPTESFRKAGQCAAGWLAFADVPAQESVSSVLYANSLGDAAVWEGAR